MKEFGEYLRGERLARGITLDEIEGRTRIRRQHLQAIESGEFHRLPEEPYVRAFLRHYATCIGLDPDAVIEQYEQLKGSAAAGHIAASANGGRSERRMRQLRARRRRRLWQWLVVVLVLAVLASITFSEQLRGWFSALPSIIKGDDDVRVQEPFVPTTDQAGAEAPAQADELLSDHSGESGADGVPTHAAAAQESDLSLEPVQIEPSFAAPVAHGNGVDQGETDDQQGDAPGPGLAGPIDLSTDPVVIPASEPGASFVLGLVARQTSWAELHVDGVRVLYRNLEPNEELTYEVQSEAYVRFGRASDVVLYVNGNEVGTIGTGVASRRLLLVHPTDVRSESE